MFGRDKKKMAEEPKIDICTDKDEDDSSPVYWRNHVKELAIAQTDEIMAKAQQYFDEFTEEDRVQREGFSFNCRRLGDFFTIEIVRKGNHKDKSKMNLVETLNLNKVDFIGLVEGNPVDYDGFVEFSAFLTNEYGGSCSSGYEWIKPPKGYEYEVKPNLPYSSSTRTVVFTDSKKYYYQFHKQHSNVSYQLENYPRPSQDDIIYLDPLGLKIPVPYGMGQTVLNQILQELERGSPRDPIVIRV